MDLIQFKIKKDNNTISYIKIIREYDKSISMAEIKKNIEDCKFVYNFDLESRDWMYIEDTTEFEWHLRFYELLNRLESAGAELEIFINGNKESMQLLNNWIHTIKEISDDCEKYPD